jgi:hypothetical protein
MKKHKHPYKDPNNQVHSEFETTVGNSFKAVRQETPAKNKNEADENDPLNEVPGDEYDLINEWNMEEEPPTMSAGGKGKFDKTILLLGLLGLVGLIGLIGVIRLKKVDELTS